jgi:hypothetical protein
MPLSAERMRTEFSSPPSTAAVLSESCRKAARKWSRWKAQRYRETAKARATGSTSRAGNQQSQRQLTRARGLFPKSEFPLRVQAPTGGSRRYRRNLIAEDGRARSLSPASHGDYTRWPDANSARVDCQSARRGHRLGSDR